MPKRVRIEITDEDGTTYSLGLQGNLSHEKVRRMMELMDALEENNHGVPRSLPPNESTVYGRILKLIQDTYSLKEFSSADIARDYEDKYSSPIPLSTVSTYLSRLADKRLLNRQKFGNSWVYRLSHVTRDHVAT